VFFTSFYVPYNMNILIIPYNKRNNRVEKHNNVIFSQGGTYDKGKFFR
jgi:hypothetical protein